MLSLTQAAIRQTLKRWALPTTGVNFKRETLCLRGFRGDLHPTHPGWRYA
ncbi:MAG: hypothetical protein ACPGVO_10010 [Spirulinaceae cyanobacterium]